MKDSSPNKYMLSEKGFSDFEKELARTTIGNGFQPFYIKKGVISSDGENINNYGIICMRAPELSDFLDGNDPTEGLINLFDGKYTITTSNDSIKKIAEQFKIHNIS